MQDPNDDGFPWNNEEDFQEWVPETPDFRLCFCSGEERCFVCTDNVISEQRLGEYKEQSTVARALLLFGEKRGLPYEVLVMIYLYVAELYEAEREVKRVQRAYLLHGLQTIGYYRDRPFRLLLGMHLRTPRQRFNYRIRQSDYDVLYHWKEEETHKIRFFKV